MIEKIEKILGDEFYYIDEIGIYIKMNFNEWIHISEDEELSEIYISKYDDLDHRYSEEFFILNYFILNEEEEFLNLLKKIIRKMKERYIEG